MFSPPQGLCDGGFFSRTKRRRRTTKPKNKNKKSLIGCPLRPTYQQIGITSFLFLSFHSERIRGWLMGHLHIVYTEVLSLCLFLSFFLSFVLLVGWQFMIDMWIAGRKHHLPVSLNWQPTSYYNDLFVSSFPLVANSFELTWRSREENTTCQRIWTDNRSPIIDCQVHLIMWTTWRKHRL